MYHIMKQSLLWWRLNMPVNIFMANFYANYGKYCYCRPYIQNSAPVCVACFKLMLIDLYL